jgi:hypothetical protein
MQKYFAAVDSRREPASRGEEEQVLRCVEKRSRGCRPVKIVLNATILVRATQYSRAPGVTSLCRISGLVAL